MIYRTDMCFRKTYVVHRAFVFSNLCFPFLLRFGLSFFRLNLKFIFDQLLCYGH